MTPEQLLEQVPAAQQQTMADRAFKAEAKDIAQGPYRDTLNDHQSVMDSLAEITKDLQYSEQAITLGRVDETTDEDTQQVNPAGKYMVKIVPLNLNQTERRQNQEIMAYNLVYTFEADNNPNNVGAVEIGLETTIDMTRGQRDRPQFTVDRFEHAWFNAGNVEELADYRDIYLPMRADEISNLQGSVEMIKAAMGNPELNPWVEGVRKERQEKQERQRQQQEERVARAAEERAAHIAAQEAREREEAEAAALAAQAPEPSRGLLGRRKKSN